MSEFPKPPCGGCGRIGEKWTPGSCRFCWAWRETKEYQAKWGPCPVEFPKSARNLPTPPANNLIALALCRHRSEDPIPGEERARLGLGHFREYWRCAVGVTLNAAKVAGVVCSCAGCGPKCPRYSLGEIS